VLTQLLRHHRRIHAAVRRQQFHQRCLDPRLALACGQVQNPQVLLGRSARLPLAEHVIDHAEVAAGKHLCLIAVVGERPRLAHQPVDHVPVVDAVLAPAAQARQPLDQLLGIPDLHLLGVQSHFHPLADQPAEHRVIVPRHMDDAAFVHAGTQPLA